MKLKETIRRILKEETKGIDTFIVKISSKYNISDDLRNYIKKFIEESNCKNIEFVKFKIPALGIALHDGVLINEQILSSRLEHLLFVVFHETAHQYQFKKYGDDVMYSCYLNEITDEEAAKFMKNTEEVADEFAGRKIRQLQKQNLIKNDFISPKMYKNVPINQIKMMINNYREKMKKENVTSHEKISEFFYNMVKSEL
jgi:hypothetical protein